MRSIANRSEWHGVPSRASHLMSVSNTLPAFGTAQAFECQCSVLWWHSVAQSGACHTNNLQTLVRQYFNDGTAWHGVTTDEYGRVF